jgi:KUP system potassium uptake protein
MDEPNVPEELNRLQIPDLPLAESQVSYFLGHETLLATDKPGLARWREKLFVFMSRNAQRHGLFPHPAGAGHRSRCAGRIVS